jgi:hypothetical protein
MNLLRLGLSRLRGRDQSLLFDLNDLCDFFLVGDLFTHLIFFFDEDFVVESVSVLLDCELFIVIHWDFDDIRATSLLFYVSELPDIRVVHGLIYREPVGRVKG